jgi:radical SAM protein with 4Fe4S-binding SPASM domain
MRPEAMDVVELFASNFAVDIKTNGLRIEGDAIARLVRLPLIDLQISVYEIHDGQSATTRTPYPFGRVAEVAGVLAAGGVRVTLSVLVTKHNIDHLDEIHRILSAIGGCTVFYSPYITPRRTGAGAEVQGRLSSGEMHERLLPFLREIDAVPKLRRYRCTESADTVCYAGRDQVAVLADGTVLPCLDMNVLLGNVQREPLAAVLGRRRERLSGFAMAEVSKCLRCSERDYCDSCPGIALAESGDWRIPVEHKCDVTKLYRAEGRR